MMMMMVMRITIMMMTDLVEVLHVKDLAKDSEERLQADKVLGSEVLNQPHLPKRTRRQQEVAMSTPLSPMSHAMPTDATSSI
jgi:hypothetical protein